MDRQEEAMLRAFRAQAAEVCARRDLFLRDDSVVAGLESEVAVVNLGLPEEEIEARRDAMLDLDEYGAVVCELGASQIEFRTDPYDLCASNGNFAAEYRTRYEELLQRGRREGVHILRSGSNPFYPVIGARRTLRKKKYRQVPDFQNLHRRKEQIDTGHLNGVRVDIGDASSVSLLQAFQVNVQASSLEDAVDKMNRSFMISPYLVAIAGNARFLDLTDTGMNDLRLGLWEVSHDTRTVEQLNAGMGLRIGLPEEYFGNIEGYFRRMERYPFILNDEDHALQIATGLSWLDTRVKIMRDTAVVELRTLSTQPAVEDEIALTYFYVGRLIFSQATKEPLLPISVVRRNRQGATHRGLTARLSHLSLSGGLVEEPAPVAILAEMNRAKEGLSSVGIDASPWFDHLLDRLAGGTPSDRLSRALGGARKVEQKELADALAFCGMLE